MITVTPSLVYRRHFDKFMLDKTQIRSTSINKHHTDLTTPGIYVQDRLSDWTTLGAGFDYTIEQITSNSLGKHSRYNRRGYFDIQQKIQEPLEIRTRINKDDYSNKKPLTYAATNLEYRLTDKHTFDAGIAKSVRVPSFTELYYQDPTTIGNPLVSPEKAMNYQAGYKFTTTNLSWGTSVFCRKENQFLDWVKHTATQSTWQIENISDATAAGTELFITIKPVHDLDIAANYSFVNKQREDNGIIYKYGSNYTKHHINTDIAYATAFGTPSLGIDFKKQTNGRDPWTLIDLGYTITFKKTTTVFARITNVCNSEYQEIEGISQPGRYSEAGVRIDW
jgi:iron complex outermembrane receptor protein